MAERLSGWARESADRVAGSDPGLNRLRMALGGAAAMSSTLGVEFVFAQAIHAGPQGTLISMLLGTVVAMMGSMALSGPSTWTKVRTAAFFPVAIGLGMLAGVAVAGHTDLMLGVFVAIMFGAVFVRRFGIAFFFYGFMTWMGYFFAAFMNATLSSLPGMLIAVVVGAAWVLLLSVTVLRTNAGRTLRRTQRAFRARAGAVARACADLLATVGSDDPRQRDRARRRLHARQLRLAETALVIEGWSAESGALPPDWSAAALRRHLLDAQLSVDALAATADSLATSGGRYAPAAMLIASHLARRDYPAAERTAHQLLDRIDQARPVAADGGWPARHLATAALDFTALLHTGHHATDGQDEEFEPAVTLAMGNLPGSPSVASDVEARGGRWNPLSRLKLTTRQSVQVAVAGALAIMAGRELSETRYYWAVIAAFIAFTGTGTRSETFIKASNRVLGTLLGLGAGIGLAHLTAGHPVWVLVVIVASMSCGFYLVRISYASMIFFVTIMVSQLYGVLHEFSAGLLVLRLEETAIGAAAGIAVALLVLPTSTRDTAHSAWRNFCTALAELLRSAARRLRLEPAEPDEDGTPPPSVDALARTVDNRLRQLALVSRPLVRPLVWGNHPGLVRHRLVLCAAAAGQVRALAVGLRRRPAAVPAGDLAAACDALADAAEALVDDTSPTADGRPGADRRLATVKGALLTRPEPADSSGSPITWSLIHLRQLLEELAHLANPATRHPVGGHPVDNADQAVAPVAPAAPVRAGGRPPHPVPVHPTARTATATGRTGGVPMPRSAPRSASPPRR